MGRQAALFHEPPTGQKHATGYQGGAFKSCSSFPRDWSSLHASQNRRASQSSSPLPSPNIHTRHRRSLRSFFSPRRRARVRRPARRFGFFIYIYESTAILHPPHLVAVEAEAHVRAVPAAHACAQGCTHSRVSCLVTRTIPGVIVWTWVWPYAQTPSFISRSRGSSFWLCGPSYWRGDISWLF